MLRSKVIVSGGALFLMAALAGCSAKDSTVDAAPPARADAVPAQSVTGKRSALLLEHQMPAAGAPTTPSAAR